MDLSNILAKAKGMMAGVPGLFNGDDPKKKKPLSYDQINQWSEYAEANPSGSLDEMWKGFSAKYPNSGIELEVLRGDLDKLMAANQRLSNKVGSEAVPNPTTGFSFPRMVIDGRDYGRVNADLRTAVSMQQPTSPDTFKSKAIPKDATEFWFDPTDNEVKYVDPESGEVKYAAREALNDPRIRKSIDQQKKDAALRGITTANSPASLVTQ